jgi:hypothetical protein
MKYRRLIILVFLLEMTSDLHAETLGRLFYSAAERASLSTPSPTTIASQPKIQRHIDGIIQRSDGRQLVWRNGQLQPQTAKKFSENILTLPIPKQSITFQVMPHSTVVPP